LDLPSAWNVINADDYVLGQQLTFWVPATIAGCDGLKHNLATAPRNYFDLRASYILLKREHVPIQVRQRRRIIVENSPPHTDPRNPVENIKSGLRDCSGAYEVDCTQIKFRPKGLP